MKQSCYMPTWALNVAGPPGINRTHDVGASGCARLSRFFPAALLDGRRLCGAHRWYCLARLPVATWKICFGSKTPPLAWLVLPRSVCRLSGLALAAAEFCVGAKLALGIL